MKRKEFLKTCGAACMGVSTFSALLSLQACSGTKIIAVPIDGENLIVPLAAFEIKKDETLRYRPYVVVQNRSLRYPICIYRFNKNDYKALYMRCTHQGTELQVFGDKLQCPAHGSEFANNGNVTSGPAENDLRTFAIAIEDDQLKISLR